mgnify:CR=1 FL=1
MDGMSGMITLFREKMARENLPGLVIDTFEHYYAKLTQGATGVIYERDIRPVVRSELASALDCACYANEGVKALPRTVVIKLNGGLGTTLGLDEPKSLLAVRGGHTFIDLVFANIKKIAGTYGLAVPVVFMNSFHTHQKTLEHLQRNGYGEGSLPASFLQHKFPKVLCGTLGPASWPRNPRLEWNPPGHGNIYTALVTSGILRQMLDAGKRYAFVSNVDNLGASLDLGLLGYFASRGIAFMMEVVERTAMDRKGGHLARQSSGKLILREIAQTAPDELDTFQDIRRHAFFNTNNIWLNLERLDSVLRQTGGVCDLPMIANMKNLDPRDLSSPMVYQIETAMGAAIGIFDDADAVVAPRIRFSPVKRSEELLLAWSDYYALDDQCAITFNPRRTLGPIDIRLDPACYRTIDQMRERFACGAPSLIDCASLDIRGDVRFGGRVKLTGNVVIENRTGRQVLIDNDTHITGGRVFG